MKLARKREQELNIQKKKKEREEHKQKCLRGMGIDSLENPGAREGVEDDDVDWYRKEVGEDPDEGNIVLIINQAPMFCLFKLYFTIMIVIA